MAEALNAYMHLQQSKAFPFKLKTFKKLQTISRRLLDKRADVVSLQLTYRGGILNPFLESESTSDNKFIRTWLSTWLFICFACLIKIFCLK